MRYLVSLCCVAWFAMSMGCTTGQVRQKSPHAAGAIRTSPDVPKPAIKRPVTQAPGRLASLQTLQQALAGIAIPQVASNAFEQGQRQASADIKRGNLTLRTYGYPAASRQTYRVLIKRRFGVTLDAVAGCVVSTGLIQRTRGYNQVVEAVIAKVYGANALAQAGKDARRMTYGKHRGGTP